MSNNGTALYEFSDFRLDVPERLLLRKGKRVSLSEKAFQTLCVLVEQAPHLVTKNDLMSKVWPDTIVEENNLDKSVSALRQALGDRKGKARFIETVRGHGYRFVPKVRCINSEERSTDNGKSQIDFPVQKNHTRNTVLVASVFLILVVAAILFAPLKRESQQNTGTSGIQSVAVMPFVNLSNDNDQDYFADGLAEDILNALAKNPKLRVVTRNSAFGFKGTNEDLSAIGKKLDVANILSGSVRKDARQLRITAKLVRVADGSQVWSETYDREVKDVFEIQSDVATQIATALQAKFSPSQKKRMEKNPTVSITAYDYYLKGREYYIRRHKEDNERSIQLFQKALEVDPNFALAYTGLADAYHKRSYLFGLPESWLDESIKACQKAIAIDPDLPEAYEVLSKGYESKRNIAKSVEAAQKALVLNPNSSNAMGMYSLYLTETGKLVEALELAKKVVALSPTDSWSYYNLGSIYMELNDLTQAKSWSKRSLELQPDFTFPVYLLAMISLIQGNVAEARDFAGKVVAIDPSTLNLALVGRVELYAGNYDKAEEQYRKAHLPMGAKWIRHWMQYSFALLKMGRIEDATKILERSKKTIHEVEILSRSDLYNLAAISAMEGNKPEAYLWLQKSIDAGNLCYHTMINDPLFETLHDETRFREMMKKLENRLAEMRKSAASKIVSD
ncbi:tetratricopeptide repeat protein [bacterium]|nr:tetratricopeptide repeat protein [bacterium]MCI0604263.1 tetratricopeptide repeat protein [bacterium]